MITARTTTMIVSLVLCATVSSCFGFVTEPTTTTKFRQQPLAMANPSPSPSSSIDRRNLLIGAGGILSSSLIIDYSNGNADRSYRANAAEEYYGTKKPFPTWQLAGNVEMPVMALNTVGLSVEDTVRACEIATANGFRHFDFHPGKETEGVAQFLKKTKIPRSEFFLTTKIKKPPVGISPEDAAAAAQAQLDENLGKLGGYADMLMTRDSPDPAVMQAQWKVLEDALKDGKTRSVGVINFCEDSIRALAKTSKVRPAVDYYYYHVGMNNGDRTAKLQDFLKRFKIKTFAYGAIGEPGPYNDERILRSPILKSIGDGSKVYNARNHGPGDKSPAEIAVKWVIDTGNAVSVRPTETFGLGTSVCGPGSECEEGLRKRGELFDWNLTGEEIYKLSNIPSLKSNDNPTLFSSSGCPGERPIP